MAISSSLTRFNNRTSSELAPIKQASTSRGGHRGRRYLSSFIINKFSSSEQFSSSKQKWLQVKNLNFHQNGATIFRCLFVILSIFVCMIGTVSALQQESETLTNSITQDYRSSSSIYQPSLIGFRCDISHEVTSDGVSVMEANKPVTLTLYGESFTTETIVAFTTEFRGDPDVDPQHSTHSVDETQMVKQTIIATDSPQMATANSTEPASTTHLIKTGSPEDSRRFNNRRRTKNLSYDCTDYNRVTSYKLTKDHIITPNVVMLTVVLPELDMSSGMYYYFCLKQPRLTTSIEGSQNNESLVWVHQGTEWWVTLRVEPPILSIANDCVLIILLLFLSAVTSGLNLGLMSLDMNELAVISSSGDPRERSYARTIAPLRKRGNYLLCSLLLGNVMVNSTLTVILEEMTSGLVAVIGSTLAIVVLGEIVPQAFCARQGLAIGAKTIYLTYAFMIITFPLSYPIACLLDYVLGEEKGNVYDRERLMEFIKITGHHTQLEADEVAIISGALKLKKIKVDQIMTRIEDVFMLPIDCRLDRDTIKRIIEKGYSRIPVFEFGDRKQIVALILAKDLALLDPDDHTPIASMLMYCKHPLIFIEDDATLDVALNEFKTGKSHMAVVRQIYDDGEVDKYYEAIGVVTLEDVIEEVLQVEINDETDTLSDNRRKRRRTDAQVSHLIDEFTCRSLPLSGVGAKPTDGILSDQLTCVSVESVAHSLAQIHSPQCDNGSAPQPGIQQSQASFRSAREFSASDCLQMAVNQDSPNLLHSDGRTRSTANETATTSDDGGSVLGRAAQYLSNMMR